MFTVCNLQIYLELDMQWLLTKMMGTKNQRDINKLNPDYVLVSHGHYDHLDAKSIKYFDNTEALIPLGMSNLINKMNRSISTQEAGWFQQFNTGDELEIYFLPSHPFRLRECSL